MDILCSVLNSLDFEMESLSFRTWELFDDSQVAAVLEHCQVSNSDSASQELLIAVPMLHKIFAVKLSTIQVAATMNYELACNDPVRDTVQPALCCLVEQCARERCF